MKLALNRWKYNKACQIHEWDPVTKFTQCWCGVDGKLFMNVIFVALLFNHGLCSISFMIPWIKKIWLTNWLYRALADVADVGHCHPHTTTATRRANGTSSATFIVTASDSGIGRRIEVNHFRRQILISRWIERTAWFYYRFFSDL